jgi:hypothetical protein
MALSAPQPQATWLKSWLIGCLASAAMIATGTGPRGELAIIDAAARASRRSADDLIASSAATPSVATTETA